MKTIKEYKGFLLGLLLGAMTILAMGSVINPSMSPGENGKYRLETEMDSSYIYYALIDTMDGKVHAWRTLKQDLERRAATPD